MSSADRLGFTVVYVLSGSSVYEKQDAISKTNCVHMQYSVVHMATSMQGVNRNPYEMLIFQRLTKNTQLGVHTSCEHKHMNNFISKALTNFLWSFSETDRRNTHKAFNKWITNLACVKPFTDSYIYA